MDRELYLRRLEKEREIWEMVREIYLSYLLIYHIFRVWILSFISKEDKCRMEG